MAEWLRVSIVPKWYSVQDFRQKWSSNPFFFFNALKVSVIWLGTRHRSSSYTLLGICWLIPVMCSRTWTHSSSSSCWICPFSFSVLGQVHTQLHGEGCCFLFPVIGGIESGSGQRHVGNLVYVHGFSYSCEFLVHLVHLELSLLNAGMTNGTFSSNTRFRSYSLHGSIHQLPQLCKV